MLRLSNDSLVLEHRLKNTGRKPIATTVYNHNFFTIDEQPTGPDFVVRFAFEPRAMRPLGELGALAGKELTFARELAKGQTVFTELEASARPPPTTISAWRTARHAPASA